MARLFLFFIFLQFSSIAFPQGKQKANHSHTLEKNLIFLSSDSLKGRMPGTPEADIAADYISRQFKKLKLKPYTKSGYFQEFTYVTPDSEFVKTRNVIAFLNRGCEKTIIIGAHYDHIGFGGKHSRAPGKKEIHNGADDNASGVALLLELAAALRSHKKSNYNYLFIAYSGHEQGLFGSRNFRESILFPGIKTALVLNLDMVGRLDTVTRSLIVYGNLENKQLGPLAQKANLKLIYEENLTERSDLKEFVSLKIPLLGLSTGFHDDYHAPGDDFEKLNVKGIREVQYFILSFLKDFNAEKK